MSMFRKSTMWEEIHLSQYEVNLQQLQESVEGGNHAVTIEEGQATLKRVRRQPN